MQYCPRMTLMIWNMQNNSFSESLKQYFGLSEKTVSLMKETEQEYQNAFLRVEEIAKINQLKVLKAFQNHRVSYAHLGETTGYGYDDLGRDTLDQIWAEIFGAEDALVRHNIVSGTQAIASCLYGILRPGDTMASVVGGPYDTMEEVIGLRGEPDSGSLMDFGVSYTQVDLLPDGKVDFAGIQKTIKENKIKLALIQRSRGYAWRDSLTVDEIGKIIDCIKEVDSEVICMVDNCYGEFVEDKEPTQVGADIIVGSLIKNAGGSLALSGGYVAGRKDLVEKISYRLTAPGLGRHTGASLGFNRNLYQGLFMAPHVVAESIKTAILCAGVFKKLGYPVCPEPEAMRSDIIQAVKFGNPKKLIAFCQAIQAGSPIDSHVRPEPWEMPGYGDPVIMAAGAFVQGASIELSADAPICDPYIAYMQGGVIYDSAKIGILKAADAIGEVETNA